MKAQYTVSSIISFYLESYFLLKEIWIKETWNTLKFPPLQNAVHEYNKLLIYSWLYYFFSNKISLFRIIKNLYL